MTSAVDLDCDSADLPVSPDSGVVVCLDSLMNPRKVIDAKFVQPFSCFRMGVMLDLKLEVGGRILNMLFLVHITAL